MSAEKKIWINDGLVATEDARISPFDRGFTLGDGLFETMLVRGGEVLRLEKHLARLRDGAEVLGLSLSWDDSYLSGAISHTLNANELRHAFLRLTVSRGVPNLRGLLPEKDAKPTLVIECGEFSGYPDKFYHRGMRLITSSIRRNEFSPLSSVKSLNYLDSILARQEAAEKDFDDALMLNTVGNIACASAANIFFVKDETMLMLPLSDGALPGTMRAHVVDELAPKYGVTIVERSVSPAEIPKLDEAFLTNTLMGIMPVVSVDNQMIGMGSIGSVTLALSGNRK